MAYIPVISGARIKAGAITNDDISGSANIALSKLATDPLARANHTGSQTASTISDFSSTVQGESLGGVLSGTIGSASFATDPFARANHTGSQLHTTISDFDTGVQTNRLDQMAAPTAAVSMNSQKITSVSDGTASGDAVNLGQLNAVVAGQHQHAAVDLATTSGGGDLDLTGEETIDGTLTSTSRVLVKDQTDSSENGIYDTGAGAWSRVSDMDEAAEVQGGDTVFVLGGSANGDTVWTQTEVVVTLDTDDILWIQTGAAPTSTTFDDLTDVDLTAAADTAMVWNDNGTWKDTTTLTFDNDTGQLALTTTGSGAGIVLGASAELYEVTTGVLRTDTRLDVGANTRIGTATITMAGGNSVIDYTALTATTTGAFKTQVSGDSQRRYCITADGTNEWGSGSVARDTNLYRSTANTLKTDDAFIAGGALTSEGGRVLNVTEIDNTDSPYTVLATDDVILVDTSTAAVTINLQAVSAGRRLRIKDSGGNAGTNNITLDGNASENIDGALTFAIDEDYMGVDVIPNATENFVF